LATFLAAGKTLVDNMIAVFVTDKNSCAFLQLSLLHFVHLPRSAVSDRCTLHDDRLPLRLRR
jgi:hypothetical protein